MGYPPQGAQAGITKLSEMEIDADKDWLAYGIHNLKELAAGMTEGDIVQHGSVGVLKKLSPGPLSWELTSSGPGKEIVWKEPPTP